MSASAARPREEAEILQEIRGSALFIVDQIDAGRTHPADFVSIFDYLAERTAAAVAHLPTRRLRLVGDDGA